MPKNDKIVKSKADVRKMAYRPNRKLKPLSRLSHSQSEASKDFRRAAQTLDGVTEETLSAARLAISRELGQTRKRNKRGKRAKTLAIVRGMFKGLSIENIII